MKRVVCFGEMMLRLEAPRGEILLQTPRLRVTYTGAEANVAVSLARFGRPASMVTITPDNRLGQATIAELRRYGVDVSRCRTAEGRMGLFFVTQGAVLRPSEVLYDRAESAFALAPPDFIDWKRALDGAGWLHVSGITPALGPDAAAAAVRAVEEARRLGVGVSFDGNFRPTLWARWDVDPAPIIRRMIEGAAVAFAEVRDLELVLGRTFEGDAEARNAEAAAAAFEAFPELQVLTHTVRVSHDVDDQDLSAVMRTRDGGEHRAGPYRLTGIVDRIGGGDAYTAGVLHRLVDGDGDPQGAVAFGLAASALKHGVHGDFNQASEAEVLALMEGGGLDVRR